MMPKPQSRAHMAVAYDFVERRMTNRFLRENGQQPKISKRYYKQVANRGDRKAARLELQSYLMSGA